MLPKFFVVRFAPGAAGNFVSSIVQCSREVAHWSQEQQIKKPNNDWLTYFQSVYQPDFKIWLFKEPLSQLDWGIKDIFSSKYPRGNNLTVEEFLQQEKQKCNAYYHDQKAKDVYLPVFWNKTHVPVYFKNSVSVTILLDEKSMRWYDHCVYYKHHQIVDVCNKEVTVKLMENHPSKVLPAFADQNEYEKVYPSFKSFVKDRIVDNPFRNTFRNHTLMNQWTLKNVNINLSDVLDAVRFYKAYTAICDTLGIQDRLSEEVVVMLHTHWRGLHAF